ncbi:MAG: MgtC/SapB family protein [Chroococcidiopsidaceae cyanobacterium CP_BM_ER_R8_30]|nr:MgtC/SapB family protein [Chroococcidiopsidaceae cyanobacterium CP_BM_ER_R8_30]
MSNTISLTPNDLLGITSRLCLALLFGAIIGLERQRSHKPAGLRTHMLVSFGSASFILISLLVTTDQASRDAAISRVIQGITTGIGFLGAGEILRISQKEPRQVQIQGLTSAAAVWVSAALGIAAGCGLWQMGLIASLLTFVVLSIFQRLERRR